MWLINESRMEGFSVLNQDENVHFGGKGAISLWFSTQCSLRAQWDAQPWQWLLLQLGHSWTSSLVLEVVWPPGKLTAARESSGEHFGPWHEGPCVSCWWNASLMCSFGGEGSKGSWKAPQPHLTRFPSFVSGWTRQEGWGRRQRCWCKDVFLLFYFWFCHFAVLQPLTGGFGGAEGEPTVKCAEQVCLGFEFNVCQKPWSVRFPWPCCHHVLEHLSPQRLFCHMELVGNGFPIVPPSCWGTDSQKRPNCKCRALEFSHPCSQSLRHFPTSLWPFNPHLRWQGQQTTAWVYMRRSLNRDFSCTPALVISSFASFHF